MTGSDNPNMNRKLVLYLIQMKKPLCQLARENGLKPSTLSNALRTSWLKGEFIIAHCLGLSPIDIWPHRYYQQDGTPLQRFLRAPLICPLCKKELILKEGETFLAPCEPDAQNNSLGGL